MKVIHVITGLEPGGAENQLRLLLRHTRHHARVVTLVNPGAVATAIRAEGTPVTHLGMRSNRDLTAIMRLRALIASEPCDLVHTHLYRAILYGRVAAKLARVPHVVATEHSLGDGYIEGRRTSISNRLLYLATEPLSDATIAVSAGVRERLSAWGVTESKLHVIPNGIDPDALAFDPGSRLRIRRELGLPSTAAVVGALGRLDPVKRFDALVEAMIPLLGPEVRLLIVGDGPMRTALADRIEAAGVGAYAVLAGERSEPAALLSSMDLLVAPSASETFGLAAVEALAAGLPVLYDRCPAIEESPALGTAKAERVVGRVPELRAAIASRLVGLPTSRDVPPTTLTRFSIRECAAAVDRLYEDLAGQTGTAQ